MRRLHTLLLLVLVCASTRAFQLGPPTRHARQQLPTTALQQQHQRKRDVPTPLLSAASEDQSVVYLCSASAFFTEINNAMIMVSSAECC